MLAGLLLVRGVAYWEIGATARWTPHLQLGFLALSFRSDYLVRMLLFSALSFLLTLLVFYIWLILLSVVNLNIPDKDPLQKLVRLHLGWVEKFPRVFKWLLPPLFSG